MGLTSKNTKGCGQPPEARNRHGQILSWSLQMALPTPWFLTSTPHNCQRINFCCLLFMIAKRWKQPQCPSTDEWINKRRSLHKIEYYSDLKMKAILTPATTWRKLGDTMLSEISQTQKGKQILHDSSSKRSLEESHPQRQQVDGGGRGLGEGMGSQCLMGQSFSLGR